MTPQDVADLAAQVERLFRAGETDEEIVRGLGITAHQVRVIRSLLGLRHEKKTDHLRHESFDREFLLREWNERCAVAQRRGDLEAVARQIKVIAVMTGLNPHSVRRIYRDEMKVLPRQKTGRIAPERWKEAREMLETKMPYPVVAKELGIKEDYLRRKLPGYGLKGRDLSAYLSAKYLEAKVGL